MSKFDKVIGYDSIKNELMRICDMIHNREIYEKVGAKLPKGILLYGRPGLGKTLMAKCLIEECGLKAYTVRKTRGNDFTEHITQAFEEAKKNAPSIIFLDDMDKFANEDMNHCDADEYVAIQAGIDNVKGYDVFVMATVNDMRKLPPSLQRSGRFDIKIEVCYPNSKDSVKIIKHYLSDKNVSDDVEVEDIAKILNYGSCAELESVLNEAAVNAAYRRKEQIEMKDIVDAVLRMEYDSPDDCTKISNEDARKIAVHEAGHLVVCETLEPGTVSVASIRKTGRSNRGGFVRRSNDLKKVAHHIATALGGKAAYEMCFGEIADGCEDDIRRAANAIRDEISENGVCGFSMVDVANHRFPDTSESLNSRNESVVQAELERYMMKARQILLLNKDFLENVTNELIEKETLLPSDIKRIREMSNIVGVCL